MEVVLVANTACSVSACTVLLETVSVHAKFTVVGWMSDQIAFQQKKGTMRVWSCSLKFLPLLSIHFRFCQDAKNEMKEMVMKKATVDAQSPKSKTRRTRRPSKASGSVNDDSQLRGPDPRRLVFDDLSPAGGSKKKTRARDDGSESPRDSSQQWDAQEEAEEEITPLRKGLDAEDADLFNGSFSRPAGTTPKSGGSSARKAARRKAGRRPQCDQEAMEKPAREAVNRVEEHREDEEDFRKDEFMKLLARIKENRLVSIIPLDCNPTLV